MTAAELRPESPIGRKNKPKFFMCSECSRKYASEMGCLVHIGVNHSEAKPIRIKQKVTR